MTNTHDYKITSDGTCLGPAEGATIRDAIIPEGVKSIREYAFRECIGMASVTTPNSVTSLGWDAFSRCPGWRK